MLTSCEDQCSVAFQSQFVATQPDALLENVVFAASYSYSDQAGNRQTASARVFCPLGLAAADELYLWGLLSLTLGQPERSSELSATPHCF